jgi:hypothetical protein
MEAGLKWAPEMSARCPEAMDSKAAGLLSKVEKAVEKRLKVAKGGSGGGGPPKFSEKNCLRDLRPAD